MQRAVAEAEPTHFNADRTQRGMPLLQQQQQLEAVFHSNSQPGKA